MKVSSEKLKKIKLYITRNLTFIYFVLQDHMTQGATLTDFMTALIDKMWKILIN